MCPGGVLPVQAAAGGLTGLSIAKFYSKCQSPVAFHSRAPVCHDQHFKSKCARRTVGCYNSPKGCACRWETSRILLSERAIFTNDLPPSPPPLHSSSRFSLGAELDSFFLLQAPPLCYYIKPLQPLRSWHLTSPAPGSPEQSWEGINRREGKQCSVPAPVTT